MMEPLRIVAIGGGTGLSALLHGLKQYSRARGPEDPALDITAVVTVTDDGGSSGRLRREFDVLPPGDIRNCMVALSEDSALLARLFQYRFASGRGLKGHSFGNLFLMALTHVMGDFPEAVKASCEVLKIAGRIYPATNTNVPPSSDTYFSKRRRSARGNSSGATSPKTMQSYGLNASGSAGKDRRGLPIC